MRFGTTAAAPSLTPPARIPRAGTGEGRRRSIRPGSDDLLPLAT